MEWDRSGRICRQSPSAPTLQKCNLVSGGTSVRLRVLERGENPNDLDSHWVCLQTRTFETLSILEVPFRTDGAKVVDTGAIWG